MRTSPAGREHTVRVFERGETFNEVPALDGGANPVTALAHTDSEVWRFAPGSLREVAHAHPALAWSLAGHVALHTRSLLDVVENLATRTVRGRLAGLLLEQASRHESATVPRTLTQEEMASQLGTVREMVSRVLHSLAADGIVAFDRHRIVILDPARLDEEAET